MPTMVYAPEVTIRIKTDADSRGKGKVIDVSDDLTRGSVTRVSNGISTANFSMLNQGRKYDGMFTPMDPVVVYFRRIKTVLKFSGHLDAVPLWAAEPASINLRASCTLKRLQNYMWDPGSAAAVALLNTVDPNASKMEDGGMAQRAINLLTQVAGWPQAQIHIARIPHDWYKKVSEVADQLIAEAEALQMSHTIGSGAWVNGANPSAEASSTIDGIGAGTGVMPATSGRISHFGGPNGGAYGNMGLTGESGVNPRDDWYCAMRWPYTDSGAVDGAKAWWTNRKILVVNPKTNKSLVLRAADWGPHISTGRVIDVSPRAIKLLGASTDDVVHMGFAPANVNLGPISTSDAGLGVTVGSAPGGVGSPTPSNTSGQNWGAAGDSRNMVTVTAAGCRFTVHRLAANNFVGFVNDLARNLGYRPAAIGGFNDRNIAGTSTKSNHAWGLAIDIDAGRNPYYSSGSGGPYALPRPPAIIQLARKWGLGWGGEWNNSKDYMHFEVIGAPSSAGYGDVKGTPTGQVIVKKWTPPIHGDYTITARFGEGGNMWSSGHHTGTDFACPDGTAIYPVGPGTVHSKVTLDASYGNFIQIDMGGGWFTKYCHMNAPSPLAVGTPVSTDTVIGHVGSTGNVTGPHVHLELKQGASGTPISIEKYVLGGANRSDPPAGTQAVQGDYSDASGVAPDLAADQMYLALFNFWQYQQVAQLQRESNLLGGYRALLNDVPILGAITENISAGLRHYCSAPNGDFIAWFPDYFGHYGQAGKMVIAPIEIGLLNGPPTIGWDDTNLRTHQFVSSATSALAGDADSITRTVTTAGIASIEFPELMMALLNVSRGEAEKMRDKYLFRFGARPEHVPMNNISGGRQEFFFACTKFMENWSQQFQAQVNVAFMPELYPGMLACFPEYGVQAYIRETTDSFDLSDGGGFSTSFSGAPWSTIGKNKRAPAPLPLGAPL